MRVSTKARYGLRALVRLARNGESLTSLSHIAEQESVSVKYLERIFASLRRGGIVEAVTGKRGGYRLKKPPSEVRIADVFYAVGEKTSLVDCVERDDGCTRRRSCPIRRLWKRLSAILEDEVRNTTIADLMG